MFQRIVEEVSALAFRIRDGLSERRGYVESSNPTDDLQTEADLWVDQLLRETLTSLDGVGQYASEEQQGIAECGNGVSVGVDPVDGSGNLLVNNVAGLIVGVYDQAFPCSGQHLIGSFYLLFGPYVTLTVAQADGTGVREFLIEQTGEKGGHRREIGRFRSLPEPQIVTLGGRRDEWSDPFRNLADDLQSRLTPRYCGAMVGDIHRLLHRGGMYGYPGTEDQPNGPSRILFEANPIALIVERAGGRSWSGNQSILKEPVDELHQKTPVFLGNAQLVDRVEQTIGNRTPDQHE